ncbi:hypothetical protein [Acetobacterium sp.]|uniref:hypothetical protein n=1 Tax=Acetobacterium sp. TaxID=1872094 RepID=UPI002F4227E5
MKVTNGNQFHKQLVLKLQAEIAETQQLLKQLSTPSTKAEIIRQWEEDKEIIEVKVYA